LRLHIRGPVMTPPAPRSWTAGPLRHASRGMLFYGITPPRLTTSPERAAEIARTTLDRLAPLALDALVVYDVDAESDRSGQDRPFPFMPMMDPAVFHARHLQAWHGPSVIYRCVGKYPEQDLASWLGSADPDRVLTVFVGASTRGQPVATRLDEAYRLRARLHPQLTVGGVLIAERHARREDEHLRMLAKQEQGCSFFVSQVFYDLDHTRNLLSDYAYTCRDRGITPQPVVLTTSPCGSAKTLEFMTWLGIEVPRWLQNAIRHSDDPLDESYEQCRARGPRPDHLLPQAGAPVRDQRGERDDPEGGDRGLSRTGPRSQGTAWPQLSRRRHSTGCLSTRGTPRRYHLTVLVHTTWDICARELEHRQS